MKRIDRLIPLAVAAWLSFAADSDVQAQPAMDPDQDTTGKGQLIRELLNRRRLRSSNQSQDQAATSQQGGPEQEPITWGSITHQSQERTYAVLVPPAVRNNGTKVPLVLVLHGGGGNAQSAMKVTGFNGKATEEGFIVAYPQGTSRLRGKLLTWNARHCCGFAMHNGVDDVGFISKLIDKLVSEYPIDPKRVYVTGMSNGGMMAHQVGIALSDKVAAIGPVVGALFGDEKQPSNSVAAIIFNGLLDRSVPVKGGSHGGRFADSWDNNVEPLSVEAQATFWAKANGSGSTKPKTIETSTVRHLIYACPGGKDVELYIIKDNGHAWPGGKPGSAMGDIPSRSLDTTTVMWDFFKRQSR